MDEMSKQYLSQYLLLSDNVIKAIARHLKRYDINGEVDG